MSDSTTLLSARIGDIAARRPGAATVFQNFGFDFCCGGDRTLSEAIDAAHVLPARVLAALASAAPAAGAAGEAWADAPASLLIEHIKTRDHALHLQEIPQLRDLATKVEVVHRDNPNVPSGLAVLLARLLAEIQVHQQREEVVLFPSLLLGGGSMAASAIQVMRAEHDDHGAELALIDKITHNRSVPAEACATWRGLYLGLTKLNDDLTMHVHLENNILFPRYEHAEEVGR
jgi:regulator of cell morphogenesis and NO signaling